MSRNQVFWVVSVAIVAIFAAGASLADAGPLGAIGVAIAFGVAWIVSWATGKWLGLPEKTEAEKQKPSHRSFIPTEFRRK